ncbi:MAG: hypothetical protein HY901_13135 [Deltaproteobacteria bacterium]|nr:hypothetical protein [Deltaproteobacteria bacterium]
MKRTLAAAAVLSLVFIACSGNDDSTSDSGPRPTDASPAGSDAGDGIPDTGRPGLDAAQPSGADAAAPQADAGGPVDAAQSGPDAALGGLDAASPLGYDAGPSSDDPCTFNADCTLLTERCECDEIEGCFCKAGPRGAGRSGVALCNSGNDCETALCIEGWPAGTSYCSGPCTGSGTDGGCGPALPVCSNIAFVGKVCIRDPHGG